MTIDTRIIGSPRSAAHSRTGRPQESALRARRAVTVIDGNHIRMLAKRAGVEKVFDIPGVVPEHVRPLFCEGNPDNTSFTDPIVLDMFADHESRCRWIRMARDRVTLPGMVGAPIVIGRDPLDSGSAALPCRETETRRDGRDAVAEAPATARARGLRLTTRGLISRN